MSHEFSNVCRLCAGYSNTFILIFQDSGPTNFAEKIKSYLHVDIKNSLDSQCQPRMCQTCCQKIVSWDQYVEKVQKVQGMFKTWMSGDDNPHLTQTQIKRAQEEATVKSVNPFDEPQSQQQNPLAPDHALIKSSTKKFKGVKKKKKVFPKNSNDISEEDDLLLGSSIDSTTEALQNRLNHTEEVQPRSRFTVNSTKEEVHNQGDTCENKLERKVHDRGERNRNCTEKSKIVEQLFMWECLVCHAPVKNWNALVKHCREKHDCNASIQCVCGKLLQSRASIMKHRMTHIIGYGYKCEYENCNKTFHRRHLLDVHSVSHMPKEKQPWMCCKCSRRFHTEYLLKQHEKIHLPQEEKLVHPCQVCQKRFCSKSAVSAHVRAVHFGERPFVCDQCGHSFTSKGILHEHLTIHSDVCNFHCKDCNKSFKTKYRLKIHMDTHVSTRYQCPTCSLTLNTRRTLRMHLLVHKDDRAFKCTTCGKAFKRSKDLKNHCNLHTGRRPYTCPFCQRTFANGSNCRSHKRRMHPEELKIYEDALAAGQPIDLARLKSLASPAETPPADESPRKRKHRKSPGETQAAPLPWLPPALVSDSLDDSTNDEPSIRLSEDPKIHHQKSPLIEHEEDEDESIYPSKASSEGDPPAVAQIPEGNQSLGIQYPAYSFPYQYSPPGIPAFPGNPLLRQ